MTATSSSRRGGRPRLRRRVLVLILAAVLVGAALVAGIGYATGLIGEGSRTDPAASADGGAGSGSGTDTDTGEGADEGADLAICHREAVFAPPEGPYLGYPGFQSPPQVIDAIKDTGWDMCTTASNHSVDAGTEGLFRTLDTFDAAGIPHSGAARSPEEMVEALLPQLVAGAAGAGGRARRR